MISIQEVGLQILGGNPNKFYVLGGSEYGIKEKYIDTLKSKYGNQKEVAKVSDVVDLMTRKHVVPLIPAVYVVRYDETFPKAAEALSSRIRSMTVAGCIVCLIEDPAQLSKIDKWLPEFTCSIDSVDKKFVAKYLHSDFPCLDDRSISIAVNSCTNYSQAKKMCYSMSLCDVRGLVSMPEDVISKSFGHSDSSTEIELQMGVASRNFKYLVNVLDNYTEGLDTLIYSMMQTMIELEKIQGQRYSDSLLKKYAKGWTSQDIYYMFMNCYDELYRIRSNSSYDAYSSLVYLFGLLTFTRIPSPEVMHS